MYRENIEEEVPINLYFDLIDNISNELNMISSKISFITTDIGAKSPSTQSPSRNELEGKLKNLLDRCMEIRNSIVK